MSSVAALDDWLPDNLGADIEELRVKAERFAAGTLSEAEFRAFRVPLGIYEQREAGAYMLRCRFPAGAIRPAHLRALAATARRYGNGTLHVTSRQDVQVHRVRLEALHPALLALQGAGLSTKGGGGNTVRNVTACSLAGVCPIEASDVTPHVQKLTKRLVSDPLSFQLPRKYKVAFSGCAMDCAGATVSDVGFVATTRDGTPGFVVYLGGGLGARSRVADQLEEFVPADGAHAVAEAVKRVFDRHGNRRNRHDARLRFLVERVGLDEFRKLYAAELISVDREGALQARARASVVASPVAARPDHGRGLPWQSTSVTPQRQSGRLAVAIPLALGDIAASTAEGLADIAQRFGDGILRATQEQNLSLRGVTERELPLLESALADIGLALDQAPILRDMTVCAGAATCRLGICLSRGLATAVSDGLQRSTVDLHRLGPVRLHISGCPNACGRHPLAQIGLYGVAKRVNGRLVPHYIVQLGGRLGVGRTRLAAGQWAIPARAVPAFLSDFLQGFVDSGHATLDAFLDHEGARVADALAQRHTPVPDFEADKNYYYDWSGQEPFSLAGRGPGECGAGVFDLIELDLTSAAEALAERHFHRATTFASRALLITRAEQPVSDAEALDLFRKLFIEEGLVESGFAMIVEEAKALADAPQREARFSGKGDAAAALVAAVRKLYDSMDASLRFSGTPATAPSTATADMPKTVADKTQDFRGVACPLNYVKTKMALDRLQRGTTLLVLLDEWGARSVPASLEKDGQVVLSVDQAVDHWRVLIRKVR